MKKLDYSPILHRIIENKRKLQDIKSQIHCLSADSLLHWISKYRPKINGVDQDYVMTPFWYDILSDNTVEVYCSTGRQCYKSTTATNILAYYATTQSNKELTYIIDNEARKLAFSEKRLREDTFLSNDILKEFLPTIKNASMTRLKLKNGTVIFCYTDEGKYKNTEGRSNSVVVSDEQQDQDNEYFPKVYYTLSQTRGRLYKFGIGGEAGSQWYSDYISTNQMEWHYDDDSDYVQDGHIWPHQGWRNKLTFENGQITNTKSELRKILSGHWVATAPENKIHGYHIPQTLFATIPLTIRDAEEKYHINPKLSIEWQQKNLPKSMYESHTLGQFYKATRRPITPEMVRVCVDKTQHIMTGEQVMQIKRENNVTILMGIDWGSSPNASSTVGAIMIYWKDTRRYQLANIFIDPCESELDEAPFFISKYFEYHVDFCVADLGYGSEKVEFMKKGGFHPTSGKSYPPVKKIKGCWTGGNLTQDDISYRQQTDIEGKKKKSHISVEKTSIIQNFIDMVSTFESNNEGVFSQLILPDLDDRIYSRLEKDFCTITRKDLVDFGETEDHRQKAKKEYNHPPDTVMSIIYCMIGKNNHNSSDYKITVIKKKRFR